MVFAGGWIINLYIKSRSSDTIITQVALETSEHSYNSRSFKFIQHLEDRTASQFYGLIGTLVLEKHMNKLDQNESKVLMKINLVLEILFKDPSPMCTQSDQSLKNYITLSKHGIRDLEFSTDQSMTQAIQMSKLIG